MLLLFLLQLETLVLLSAKQDHTFPTVLSSLLIIQQGHTNREGVATRQGVVPRTISVAPFYPSYNRAPSTRFPSQERSGNRRLEEDSCCLNRPLHDNSRCNAQLCEIVSDSAPAKGKSGFCGETQDRLVPRVSVRYNGGTLITSNTVLPHLPTQFDTESKWKWFSSFEDIFVCVCSWVKNNFVFSRRL